MKKQRRKIAKRICRICQQEFEVYPSKIKYDGAKTCSRKCADMLNSREIRGDRHWHFKAKIKRVCEICKKIFYIHSCYLKRNGGRFCSLKCNGAYHSQYINKDKCYQWKNGITPLTIMIKNLPEYKLWRNEIFKRDDYTCQECFKRGDFIEAHHKKSFKDILQEFLNEYSQFSPYEDKETLVRLAITYKPFWSIDNGRTLCQKCHKFKRIRCNI